MPLHPITCVTVETSAAQRNDHNTKNRLIRKVNVTKTMWKDLSDMAMASKD